MAMNNEPVALMHPTYKNRILPIDAPYANVGTSDWIPLYTHPAKTPAKQKYDDCMKDCDEPNPVERLRFFLSCALTGQDWLDVEPFIDDISHPAKTLTDDEILYTCIKFGFYDRISDPHFDEKTGAWSLDEDLIQFARAILRKAQEK